MCESKYYPGSQTRGDPQPRVTNHYSIITQHSKTQTY